MNIMELLSGGDRRSIGDAPAVAEMVLEEPEFIPEVVACLYAETAVLRSRGSCALKLIGNENPELLQPYRDQLIQLAEAVEQWEVREQFCQYITKLRLEPKQIQHLFSLFKQFLGDRSSIVRTCALQGMADLAKLEPELTTEVVEVLNRQLTDGTAAMRARSRMLIKQL